MPEAQPSKLNASDSGFWRGELNQRVTHAAEALAPGWPSIPWRQGFKESDGRWSPTGRSCLPQPEVSSILLRRRKAQVSRFQAQTNSLLDDELDDLRERLGLRENQKADLLRELTALASWVIRQAEAGWRIEARRGQDVETLRSPAVERVRRKHDDGVVARIELTDAEVQRLAEILDRGFSPTPALRRALSRLSDPKRRPPKLHWKDNAA